ncbi:MAG: cytochrome c oxidase subunit II [Verrucomicrobiota bacterium]
MRAGRYAVAATAILVVAGCGETQNSLAPASHQARDIASLFWWMMGGAWIGLAVVVGLLLVAWRRRDRGGVGRPGVDEQAAERRGWFVVLGAGMALPIAILAVLFVISDVFVIRATQAPAAGTSRLTVTVIGHQWWWEIRYPGTQVVTANELHIPVRTRVRVEVRTADVIHSFWVPELNRKIDAIPDQTNAVELSADAPGGYRGQCAEFCGVQHAHMALEVVAQTPAAFRRWLSDQARPAAPPGTSAARRGERIFTTAGCRSCHTIRGTSARGDVGPDLTHLAGRRTLGALTLPNTPRYLRSWIAGSQEVKPGNDMPNFVLGPGGLDDIVAYLEGLR